MVCGNPNMETVSMRNFPVAISVACLLSAGADAQTYPHATQSTGGTVSVANTYQVALPANGGRNGCEIQNTSAAVELLSTSATPTTATSIQLAAGATFNCRIGDLALSDQISITSGTLGSSFVVWAQ
jgi:hypothetical protein